MWPATSDAVFSRLKAGIHQYEAPKLCCLWVHPRAWRQADGILCWPTCSIRQNSMDRLNSRARGGGVNAERPARESSVVVIKRYFGLLACTLIALYLSLSPIYALLNFQEYASDVPHFMRYVLIPRPHWSDFSGSWLVCKAPLRHWCGHLWLEHTTRSLLLRGLAHASIYPSQAGNAGSVQR